MYIWAQCILGQYLEPHEEKDTSYNKHERLHWEVLLGYRQKMGLESRILIIHNKYYTALCSFASGLKRLDTCWWVSICPFVNIVSLVHYQENNKTTVPICALCCKSIFLLTSNHKQRINGPQKRLSINI